MDNSVDGSVRTWGPRPALVGAGWVLAGAAGTTLGFTVAAGDRPGILLLALLTAALTAAALHGTVVRPRLAADNRGVRVRTLGGIRSLEWSRLDVRLTITNRLGRQAAVLELERTDDTEHETLPTVLGWVELGADPRDVYADLNDLRR